MKSILITIAMFAATTATAATLPSDCGKGLNAPIVTTNSDGSKSYVWPNTIKWCEDVRLAPAEDPTFKGEGDNAQ